MPQQKRYLCNDCGKLSTNLGQEKVYECQNCFPSARFTLSESFTDLHHCPDCNQLSKRVNQEKPCVYCYSEAIKKTDVVTCDFCEQLMELGNYENHLEEEHPGDLSRFYVEFMPVIDSINTYCKK